MSVDCLGRRYRARTRGVPGAKTKAANHRAAARNRGRRFGIGADHQQPDSGADRETRTSGRDRDVVRLPDTRGIAPRRSGRVAGRLGARQFRPRPSGRPPLRQRLARLPVPARSQQPAARVRERGGAVSRSRSTTGWRAGSSDSTFTPSSRATACSTRCTRSARRATRRRPTSSRPGSRRGRDLPQHHHRVARDEPGGEHVRGHPARAAPRGPHRRQPDPPVRRGRVQPDGEARRADYGLLYTSGSDTGSATAADRMRTIPARRSASTRSSPPSCGSIRAVRRCRAA